MSPQPAGWAAHLENHVFHEVRADFRDRPAGLCTPPGPECSVDSSGSLATEIQSRTAAASDSSFQPMLWVRTSDHGQRDLLDGLCPSRPIGVPAIRPGRRTAPCLPTPKCAFTRSSTSRRLSPRWNLAERRHRNVAGLFGNHQRKAVAFLGDADGGAMPRAEVDRYGRDWWSAARSRPRR